EILTYSAGRHRGDLIELIAQSVDHKTLCLSFFTRPLLGIPQRYCEASRLKAATGWRTTFLLYTVKSSNSTEQVENMIDHYYVTHAQILALRNVVAFIVQTMPEEQKENALQVLRKFAEIELMDGIDAPPTSDITPKTVEKLNKAYKAIFNDIIDLSTPGRESASASYLQ
ncbi:hypothetical protein, partial [Klebsiella michiganensis]|uniref:hypothetical protein n=3 Tax=Enterobacterales TaxID=91347 RepID=UPI00311EC95C